jgi:hypothetical protein
MLTARKTFDPSLRPMELLQALKFVATAVAKSDYLPALQHVAIDGGYIVSFNGTLALCAPVVLDLQACPRADLFAKAIEACTEPAQLHLTAQGLIVKSGVLQVTVPCSQNTFPRVCPEGFDGPVANNFLSALQVLESFVATDTTKQVFNGVLFRGSSAYATNNTVLIEYWCGHTLPLDINIPLVAVRELLRINEKPTRVQLCERSATFHYADGRWLRTVLHPTGWPSSLTQLLAHTEASPVPDGFFSALAQLAPFGEDMRLLESKIATDNAFCEVPGTPAGSRFALRQLLGLAGVATAITFTDYPQPCRFVGERTRGVILGKV